MKKKFKRFGPFSYFRVKKKEKNFLSAWLTSHEDAPFGWEWGTDQQGSNPSYCIRLGSFNLFSYENLNPGFTVFIFGFWWAR